MQHLHAVLPVGNIGEQGRVGGGHHHILRIVQRTARREALVKLGCQRLLDVDDHQAFALGGDIGIGAGQVEFACIGNRQRCLGVMHRPRQIGDVEHFQAGRRRNPQVTELHGAGPRVVQRQGSRKLGCLGIIEVHHHHAARRGDIGHVASQRDVAGAIQHAVRIPRCLAAHEHRALQEVVAWFAVGERVDIHHHQAFNRIGHHRIAVDLVHLLLLVVAGERIGQRLAGGASVLLTHDLVVARHGDRLVGSDRHAGGVGGLHLRIVAQRRERRFDDAFGNTLVRQIGDIIGDKAALAFSNIEIFAAVLDAAHFAAGALRDVADFLGRVCLAGKLLVEDAAAGPVDQLALVLFDMQLPEIGIGIAVQIGTEHRLRFAKLGHPHRFDSTIQAEKGVHADEVDEVGALQGQLRQDGVIVVLVAHMAIGAGLGFLGAHRVRVVRRKGLGREARRGNRRLLHIDALAVDVGAGQDQRRT